MASESEPIPTEGWEIAPDVVVLPPDVHDKPIVGQQALRFMAPLGKAATERAIVEVTAVGTHFPVPGLTDVFILTSGRKAA